MSESQPSVDVTVVVLWCEPLGPVETRGKGKRTDEQQEPCLWGRGWLLHQTHWARLQHLFCRSLTEALACATQWPVAVCTIAGFAFLIGAFFGVDAVWKALQWPKY